MTFKVAGTAIKELMTFHPSYTEDNIDLDFEGVTAEKIIHHTGIRYRKVANPEWSFRDYSLKCLNYFLENQDLAKQEIDFLICVTQSDGASIPSLSYFLHDKLNLGSSVYCIDVNAGCSGYVQGIHLAQTLMASISKNCAGLLICGDFSSHLIDPNDQSVRPIFSDALSITLIESSEQYSNEFSTFSFDSDGRGRRAIFLDDYNEKKLKLNGIDVFNFSLKTVPLNLKRLRNASDGLNIGAEIFFFHQANRIINDSLSNRFGLDSELIPSSLYNYGNTASASIPLTICNHFMNKKITDKHLLLCGFGVGFSVASGYVYFDTSVIRAPIILDL